MLEAALDGLQQEVDILIGGEWSHRADAQNLPRELTEAGSDLDAMLVQESLAQNGFVDAGGRNHRSQMPDSVAWIFHQRFETELSKTLDQPAVCALVTVPAITQSFFFDSGKSLMHCVVERWRRRVMVCVRRFEVFGDEAQIEVPGRRNFATIFQSLPGTWRDRDGSQPSRATETLLRTTERNIDPDRI